MTTEPNQSRAAGRRAGRGALVLLALGGALLLSVPWWADTYWIRIATGILMWAGLACAWNVIGGYAGYISFGHSAFFGLGAYATAILMGDRFAAPFAAGLLLGIVLASIAAAAIGWPTLRLRGAYFAIATWAFAELVFQLATVLDITGGTAGLSVPPFLDERFFYFSMLASALATYGVCYVLLERSRFGYRLKAVRDNELAAESLGIDTTTVKLQAFVLSAAIPALFGGIYAFWITFINPQSVLAGDIADQMVVMVLVGGLGSLWGPAIGATSMYLVNRLFLATWGSTTAYIAVLGLVIGAVVLFLPDGLVSLWPRARRPHLLHKLLARALGERPAATEPGTTMLEKHP
jgi:branched-chain amino acid transport system permease protein